MALTKIQTTTGTAEPNELGRTLIHEHVLIGYPGWELDARAPKFKRNDAMIRAVDQMHELQSHGVGTFVDPCPMDFGRDPVFLAELAQKSGMRIICTTGAYFEAEGNTYTFRHMPMEELVAIYIQEIEQGIGETGIKAGAVKIATGDGVVSDYERKLVIAGARAAKATGVPVISHTQNASCGHDQIDLVTGEGCPAEQLVVGHSDGTTDFDYQKSLADRGAFVGFDRFGISLFQPDEVRIANIIKMIAAGHLTRVLMSHDSISCWLGRPFPYASSFEAMQEMLPNWRSNHIFKEILPKMRTAGVTEEQIETILVDNPKRLFSCALGHKH